MGPKVVLTVVLLVVAVPVAGAAHAEGPQLVGIVGTNDDFVLTLSDANGPVRHLDPGTYSLLVHDRSTFHNFHLFGPGVDVTTTVDGTGDETFTVTLGDGTYTFQCDAHLPTMRATFTVGSVAPPAPPARLRGALVGSRATLTGTSGLTPGKATLAIADRSRTDGFVLRGPGVGRTTGIGFTGTVTWAVTLRAGTYAYGSAKRPAARRHFTVSP